MRVDYTEEYTPGMKIYYIFANELTGSKELYELVITKVFPEMIIAWENRGCAHMIGAEDEDNIYTSYNTAQAFFKQTTVGAKYGKNSDDLS